MQFYGYQTENFHDEMFDETGAARPRARLLGNGTGSSAG
jgi:hypothetical protein